MARTRKPSAVTTVSHLPWDKERALPIPSGTVKARRAGQAPRGAAADRPSDRPRHAAEHRRPPAREEYPGPQTSATGEHVEPGAAGPGRRRTH